jgi:hypothetical protein
LKQYLAVIVAVLAIIAALVYLEPVERYRIYDCGMAEWHPDIPPKVKEECRARNLERRKDTMI